MKGNGLSYMGGFFIAWAHVIQMKLQRLTFVVIKTSACWITFCIMKYVRKCKCSLSLNLNLITLVLADSKHLSSHASLGTVTCVDVTAW